MLLNMKKPSRLQKELRQKTPFRTPMQEAAVGLLHTADVLKRHFAAILAPFGVTLAQYNVLRILRGAGEEGLPTLAITERLIEMTPGITRLLDRLEAKGLIWRERCPSDRRQVTCRLTSQGATLLADTDPIVEQANNSAMPTLSEGQQRTLIELLDAIRSAHE